MQSLDTTAPTDSDVAWEEAKIGRYLFRRVVGSGGMGVVIAAHDPELEREVAIKLVAAAGDDADDDRALREAQAMARLSHPNVVPVYEMIRLGARTAIVMQLVEGEDLGAWYAREKPSWRAVIDAYTQAGRGLAAAHRAGIVHRDFKPSNALIDREGLVRVTDFGLARRASEATSDGTATTGVATGVAGTPAYMAPEQHRGVLLDARTDQWALGCAVFEAVYGRRPFTATDRSALATAVIRGEIEPEPAGSPVPRRIRAAIRRALSTDPDDRFASVEEFVAALAVRSRRLYYATGAVVIAVLVAATLVASRNAEAPCEGLDAPVRAAWTDPVRSQMRERLLAAGVGLPAAAVDRAVNGLDTYATTWTAMRTRVCKDARQGVRSADALDARMRCLDRHLAEMSGVVEGLAAGSGATLRAASDAVAQLAPVADCTDAKDTGVRPANPALRGEIDAAEDTLARAVAFVSLGQYENAVPLADRVATVGEHAGAPSLMARALIVRSECEDRLGHFGAALAMLQRAATAGAKARDSTVVADALSREILVDGEHLGHRGDALRTRRFIELALETAGQPDAVRAAWLHYLAILLYDDPTKVDEAAADERESLAIRRRTLPPDHIYIIDSLETLANIEAAREHFDESQRLLEQVLAARTAARGPNDSLVSAVYNNLGVLKIRRGDLLEAIVDLERSVEIGEKVGHPDTAAMFNLAVSELELGQLAGAAKTFTSALDIYERQAGPESRDQSRDVAESAMFLGVVWIAQGDYTRGRPMLLRGLDIARRSASPSLTTALSYAARLALHDGDRAKAHVLLDEAMKLPASNAPLRALVAAEVARADAGCGPARASLAKALADAVADDQRTVQAIATVELAECELALGDAQGAHKRLDAELARLTKAGADDAAFAPARTVLAKLR